MREAAENSFTRALNSHGGKSSATSRFSICRIPLPIVWASSAQKLSQKSDLFLTISCVFLIISFELEQQKQDPVFIYYSYGPPHMAEQKQDDQGEHKYSSCLRIRDVALKTCQRQWTIGRSGERVWDIRAGGTTWYIYIYSFSTWNFRETAKNY